MPTTNARIRRWLLGLYVLTAVLDMTGKALVADPAINAAVKRALVRAGWPSNRGLNLERTGNFEVFRGSARNLVRGLDLYAPHREQFADRFKYSPTFALLFLPLALLPWAISLVLWSLLNALTLFFALETVLPPSQALLAQALIYLEVLRGLQNSQTNGLVAALVVLAFVALERGAQVRAAAAIALGALIKIFPLAALTFAAFHRRRGRFAAWFAVILVAMLALPLVVLPPHALADQFRSWRATLVVDAQQRWFSVMQLVDRWLGWSLPNWPIQLAGTAFLLVPLVIRRSRWTEPAFRRLYLSSVLIYLSIFNHQAERASYLVAFTGVVIWYAGSERGRWRTMLMAVTFISVSALSTLATSAWLRSDPVMLYRLAIPCSVVWIAVQRDLLARSSGPTHCAAAPAA